MTLTPDQLYDVIDGTWPAAAFHRAGDWTVRQGAGGGKRVSAAILGTNGTPDIDQAVAALAALGQPPLFMIRAGQEALDSALSKAGYAVIDPVVAYACPVDRLCDQPLPRVSVFTIWEPLEIMKEIWAKGGIGPARVQVMQRALGPKTAIFARHQDRPAATAFAAVHNGVAMVHAVEVLPRQQRQGVGGWIMRAAALWAQATGATTLSVICTRANPGANALYSSLGMQPVGEYHYRHLAPETPVS